MKNFIAMLRDSREVPWRFWENYVIVLLAVAIFAWAVSDPSWFDIFVAAVVAFGLFLALLNAFWMGQVAAYRDSRDAVDGAKRAVQAAHQALRDLHRIEGPS